MSCLVQLHWYFLECIPPMKRIIKTSKDLPPVPDELVEKANQLGQYLNTSRSSTFDKLQAIYSYMDQYNQFVKTFTVCQNGCSHCCKYDVSITELEAHYIAYNYKLSPASPTRLSHGHQSNCPFLSDTGSCKIYDHRPLNCRALHALDNPALCATDKHHKLYGAVGGRAGILKSIEHAVKSLNKMVDGTQADIRDFFPGTPVIKPKGFWARFFS